MIEYLNGFQIIEDERLTINGDPYKVDRTWKERLFTLPWRPLRSFRYQRDQIPSTQVIQNGNKLIMHPAIAKALHDSMMEINNEQ